MENTEESVSARDCLEKLKSPSLNKAATWEHEERWQLKLIPMALHTLPCLSLPPSLGCLLLWLQSCYLEALRKSNYAIAGEHLPPE